MQCAQVILAGDSEAMLQGNAGLPRAQQVLREVAITGRTTGRSQGERDVLHQLTRSKAFTPPISKASEEGEEKPVIPYNTLPVLYWRRKVSGLLWPKTLKLKAGHCHCLGAELQQ